MSAVLLWAAIAYRPTLAVRTPAVVMLAIFVTLIGIPAATQVSRASGRKDPQFVVIDEVAGQLIALIAVPLAWKTFLAGFILFRASTSSSPRQFGNWKGFPRVQGSCSTTLLQGFTL